MHPAAPSAAEAARDRPAVKTGAAPADDDLVTSVAFVPEDGSEPVSPELALIDPTLAERLRADLSEPPLEPEHVEPPFEPVAETTLHADDAQSALEEPEAPPTEMEPEDEPVAVAAEPEPTSASIHVLRASPAVDEAELVPEEAAGPVYEPRPEPHLELAPPPEPEPEIVPEPVIVARPEPAEPVPVARLPVVPTTPPPRSPRPSSVSPLRRRSRLWQLLVLLATIVLFAGVVTVGVVGVSALRDVSGSSGSPATSEPPAAAAPQAGDEADEPTATPDPTDSGGSKAPVLRRFAWAPVDGAVSYRFELFRGDEQVLLATTKSPAYELPKSWRHEGRAERLTSGTYRWYVWPVLASGPADAAVVQASLNVP